MNHQQLQTKITRLLQAHGIPNASLDAEYLLRSVLGITSAELLTRPETPVPLLAKWRAWHRASARARGMPMAYLIGERAFFGRTFSVNHSTLIPRPESECLIETALALPKPDAILDIGTGTGALGITLALELQVPVLGIESSRQACTLAKKNAQQLGATHFAVHRSNTLFPLPASFHTVLTTKQHALIIANLPYLSQQQWEQCPKEVRNFEPKSALVGGGMDGLNAYRILAHEIQQLVQSSHLPETITLLIEIDPSQAESAQTLLPWSNRIVHDLRGQVRGVVFSHSSEEI